MKKGFTALFLLNIILGIMIYVSYNFILSGISSESIILFIGLILIYIISIVIYFKRKKEITLYDMIISSIYYLFLIVYFVFSIKYQNSNSDTFNMMYLSSLINVLHFIYLIFGVI